MVFEGPESKSGRPFEITIPDSLVPHLKSTYRTCARNSPVPIGMTGSGPARNSSPYSKCYCPDHNRANPRDLRVIGQPTPFPTLCGNDIAILQPGRIGVASNLLGHSSVAMTNAHYNMAHSIEESRLYAGVLAGLNCRPSRRSKVSSDGFRLRHRPR
jgi:hypothetical protein